MKRFKLKFWQKALFAAMALFLLGFDVLGFVIANQSLVLSERYMREAAAAEQQIIRKSLYESIKSLSDQPDTLSKADIDSAVSPYAVYYIGQDVYLTLTRDGVQLFSNAPDNIPFIVITDSLPYPLNNIDISYKKSALPLVVLQNDMTRMLIVTSAVVSVIVSAALLFTLLRLTAPFRALNAAAAEIKDGNYKKRVEINDRSFFRDEIDEFAEIFNAMADSVQEYSENRERFINNLAHEMRTPITAIAGYADLLKIASIDESEKEKAVDYIISQSLRMKNMVYKLMNLAYMKNTAIEKLPLDVGAILSRAAFTCRRDGVAINIDDAQPAGISGDDALIESLVQNLTENAIRAGATAITIRTKQNAVIIEDNGKGMEPGEINKVTEPFYRIDKSRSRGDGGAGLGLALCAAICEIHDAKLNITSEKGAGTKITIDFGKDFTTI